MSQALRYSLNATETVYVNWNASETSYLPVTMSEQPYLSTLAIVQPSPTHTATLSGSLLESLTLSALQTSGAEVPVLNVSLCCGVTFVLPWDNETEAVAVAGLRSMQNEPGGWNEVSFTSQQAHLAMRASRRRERPHRTAPQLP